MPTATATANSETAVDSKIKGKGKKTPKTTPAATDENPNADAPTPRTKKGGKVTASADDQLAKTSAELENLSQKEAFELVPQLNNEVDFNYFKLGGVFSVIQSNDWHKDQGYDSFKALIEQRFGIKYRKAMYLVQIYTALVESGVPYTAFGSIGWTKIKEIAAVVTKANVSEWVERANLMTVLQLQEAVKAAANSNLDDQTGKKNPAATDVTTFNVKVHKDQKTTIEKAVEKAKKESNTEFNGVALELICMNYLSGAKVAKPLSLKEFITQNKFTYEDVLQTFEQLFPNIDLTVKV